MVAIPAARHALSKYSVTFRPEMNVLRAIDILVKKRAAAAPVVNEEGELVGILTEKDCLRLVSNTTWGEVSGGTVRDFMSEASTVLTTDMSLFAAANQFLDTNFPVLPLLENGRLLGRVTRQDLLHRLQALNRRLHREREKREQRLRRDQADSAALEELASCDSPEELAYLLSRS